jgi:hypothetical protein
MLLDDSPGGAATIDFLNPRQKPKQVSQQRKLAVPLALAATVLLGGAGILWLQLHSLDLQIEELTKVSSELDPKVKVEKEKQQEAAQIEEWLAGDITWLDELAAISEKAPGAQDVMLTKLTQSVPISRGNLGPNKAGAVRGTMKVDGVARSRSISEQLQRQLRDAGHQITVPTTVQEDSEKYPWSFNADLKITTENMVRPGRGPAAPKAAGNKPAPAPKTTAPKTAAPSAAASTSAPANAAAEAKTPETKSSDAGSSDAKSRETSPAPPSAAPPANIQDKST